MLCLAVPTFAAEKNQLPYESYTYWENFAGTSSKKAINNRPIYTVDTALDFTAMGVGEQLKQITDVFCDSKGYTYILDGGKSQIIILDNNYLPVNVITGIKKPTEASAEEQTAEITEETTEITNEELISFTDSKGLFVDENGIIYIADTLNARILTADSEGNYVGEYFLPESKLIPSNFEYKPIKVAKDSRDYLYVLSDGSYYGAILYSPDGEFLGFYGANTVKNSVSEAISGFIGGLFLNNEKRAQLESSLPFQFTDLCVDKTDFIYTATGNTAKKQRETQTGQIRKLSPGGSDVFNSDGINFGDSPASLKNQDILGVDVDDGGYVYALDSTYGHIFVYDQFNNTIGVFGCGTREGIQDGSFTNAVAIAVNGEDVLVADGTLNTVSIFKITEYGRKLKIAQELVNEGDYISAKPLWEELFKTDKQNQLIYVGLAKSYYDEGDYDKALEYSKLGYDRDTYALAFGLVRNEFLSKYFTILVLGAVAIIVLIVLLFKWLKKKNIKLLPENVKTAISVLRHPGDTFADIKLKQKGSYLVAVGILFLYYVTSILSVMYGGFCYEGYDPSTFNALLTLLRSVGIVVLFTVCFWAVSTLMHGQGKMGEIFITVCYSFQPMIIANAVYLVLTNVMLPNEIAFLNLFMTVMTIYTGLLLFIGLMRISDYEFGKLIGVGLLSIVGIVIVLFIGIVVVLLLQLLWGFLLTVFQETYKIMTFGG